MPPSRAPITLPPLLLELAVAQEGMVLGSQMAELYGKKRALALTRHGPLIRLWRNAYALPQYTSSVRTRLLAAELTLGHPVVACLHSAAQLYGFDLTDDLQTHFLAGHDWPNFTEKIRQHRCSPVRPHSRLNGRSVTDLAETVIRVAAGEANPAKVLAVLDRALGRTPIQIPALVAVADDLHIRGIRLVRELLPHANGKAESPGESWLRWVFIEAGLPPVEPQIWETDEYGNRYRIDLGWKTRRVGCEYEGEEFHTKTALTKDRTKYNALTRQGWLMHGATSPMIWKTRRALVADVESLLAQRPSA